MERYRGINGVVVGIYRAVLKYNNKATSIQATLFKDGWVAIPVLFGTSRRNSMTLDEYFERLKNK